MRSVHNSKKAQITVFIIIGVIILFSVGLYSYLKYSGVSPVTMFQPKSPPVVAFIDACLERTSSEAIKAMGDQGGYISIPPGIANNPTRHLSLMPGVGGEFAPKVPYWYFDGKTQIPSLRYMEVEVEHYIDMNLRYCLDNFSQMRDEYIITELSNYTSSVVFADKETIIGLDYVIEIQPRGKDEVTRKEQFIVRIDVKLKRMWELAKEILEAENRMVFYENMTMNLMSSFPSDDIPFTGMTFHCGRLQWLLSDIKKKLINALEPAVSATRFKNTDHPPFMAKDDAYRAVHNAVSGWRESEVIKPLVLPKNIPEDSYDYFQYYFQFTDKNYKEFKVVSTYKEAWGMNLLATPNQYGVLKSGVQDLKSQIMSFLCLNTYHFVYDLTYPVLVSINDPNALHRTGYVFRFAFPVQIFHNHPDRSLLPTTIIEPTEFAMDYCDFYAPEDHTIIAKDIVTNAELSKVNLTFRCLREQCILGTTRTDNRHLQWSGKFPDGCSGAIIIANRSGYLLTEKQYDGTEPFIIEMYPTQPVVFDIRRHPENSPQTSKFLTPDMYAILQLDLREPRIPGAPTIFDVFGQEDIFNRSDTFDLLRADAVYDVNLLLIQKISKDEDRMIGGWIGNWTVKLGEILDAKKVIFHIPQKFPTPRTDAEVIAVYEIMTNRSLFPGLKPEIIRADEYTGEPDDSGAEV